MRTVYQKIKTLMPDQVVGLWNEYGLFWVGRAKFVTGALSYKGLNSTSIKVTLNGEEVK